MIAIQCDDARNGPLGCIEFRTIPGDRLPSGIAYKCPRCGQDDWLEFDAVTGWQWNGSLAQPSLTPSVKHLPCLWHAMLTNGEWQIFNDV